LHGHYTTPKAPEKERANRCSTE